ncbi:MAG: hypothetical protein ACI9OJ_002319 [Myxococcota bacterium]|jgi:hypothetical protein
MKRRTATPVVLMIGLLMGCGHTDSDPPAVQDTGGGQDSNAALDYDFTDDCLLVPNANQIDTDSYVPSPVTGRAITTPARAQPAGTTWSTVTTCAMARQVVRRIVQGAHRRERSWSILPSVWRFGGPAITSKPKKSIEQLSAFRERVQFSLNEAKDAMVWRSGVATRTLQKLSEMVSTDFGNDARVGLAGRDVVGGIVVGVMHDLSALQRAVRPKRSEPPAKPSTRAFATTRSAVPCASTAGIGKPLTTSTSAPRLGWISTPWPEPDIR